MKKLRHEKERDLRIPPRLVLFLLCFGLLAGAAAPGLSIEPGYHLTPSRHKIEPRSVRIRTNPDGVLIYDEMGNYLGPSSSDIIIPCVHHQITLYLIKGEFKEEARQGSKKGFRNNMLVIPREFFRDYDSYPQNGVLSLEEYSSATGGVHLSLLYLAGIGLMFIIPIAVIAVVIRMLWRRMKHYEAALQKTTHYALVTDADVDVTLRTMDDIKGKRLIGKYSSYFIKELIGEGGMSRVYEAYMEQTGLGTISPSDEICAIKIVLPSVARSPGYLDRFRREIEIYRRLTHPSIVQIYDWGEDDARGILFIVMEKITGRPLSKVLKGRSLEIRQSTLWAIQILKALAYAHENGVVHRDIKPSNIFITMSRRIKIIDFGIARALGTADLTMSNIALGTPSYLPPEQIDSKSVDGRADLYSVGVMMYEMLTGSLPFTGESSFDVISKHVYDDAAPPSSLNPEICRSLDAFVLRLMAKNPQDRYISALEAAEMLKILAIREEIFTEKDMDRTIGEKFL